MNLWQFYQDNPTLLEAKIGDELANIAAIVTGTSTKKALNVFVDGGNVTSAPNGFPVFDGVENIYSTALVPYATPTTILSYTVPVDTMFFVTQILGWGDTSGEFLLLVDGDVKGGGRTTAADPNVVCDFGQAPVVAIAGQIVTVVAEHYVAASHDMKANLLGGVKNV